MISRDVRQAKLPDATADLGTGALGTGDNVLSASVLEVSKTTGSISEVSTGRYLLVHIHLILVPCNIRLATEIYRICSTISCGRIEKSDKREYCRGPSYCIERKY